MLSVYMRVQRVVHMCVSVYVSLYMSVCIKISSYYSLLQLFFCIILYQIITSTRRKK